MTELNARVPLLGGETYSLRIDGDSIAAVEPVEAETDLFAGPALFDIQVNGYGGRTCRMAGPDKRDALAWITRILRQRGVGWWMPTITTASAEALETAFVQCARVLDEDADTAASIPGLHLEGPYISPEDGPRGAHLREHVRPPDWDEFCRLQEASGGRIRLVTLAPEVEGAVPFIERCVESGVRVAMGHTDLDRESLAAAVAAGATLSTHLGNGAHDRLQRHNNYLWYQLACPDIYASFISDGQHLPQECLYSMLRAKGLERSVVTSDSVLLGGMPPGVYSVRDREIEMLPSGRIIIPGTANLAGSASHLLECTEKAIGMGRLTHAQGWRLASENPARLMGWEGRLGVEAGREATLALYRYREEGPRIEVRQTWVAGRKVYDAETDAPVEMPTEPADAASPL